MQGLWVSGDSTWWTPRSAALVTSLIYLCVQTLLMIKSIHTIHVASSNQLCEDNVSLPLLKKYFVLFYYHRTVLYTICMYVCSTYYVLYYIPIRSHLIQVKLRPSKHQHNTNYAVPNAICNLGTFNHQYWNELFVARQFSSQIYALFGSKFPGLKMALTYKCGLNIWIGIEHVTVL